MRSMLLTGLISASLCGCNSSAVKAPDGLLGGTRSEFVQTREQRAREYEAAGALFEAKREWQMIDAATSGSSRARVEAERLGRAADLRAKRHFSFARAAKKRSDFKSAELELLKVLALKPDDAGAIKMLKQLEHRLSYARLAATPRVSDVVESEVDVYTAPSNRPENDRDDIESTQDSGSSAQSTRISGSPKKKNDRKKKTAQGGNSVRLGLAHLSRREYELALEYFVTARENGEGSPEAVQRYLSETRKSLADQHYKQGVLAFRAAQYDQAVEEFEQALEYAPGHKKARFYYSSAKTLQGR